MADTALAVIRAAIKALKEAPAVAALVSERVFADVPQREEFPYIVVSVQSEPFAANDFSGQTHQLRIQAFSRKPGSKEALQIRKAAVELLDRNEAVLVLEEGDLIKCEYSGLSDAFIEDDGKTWQSVCELKVVVI
ncbi:DUF3168 domain-containing protein [Rhizobium sp. P007]|uniref:DUF3168 domain-containing protein n=1 Tax=Rhizobium sp. P007 TaxID=285908 RepID=UPI00163CA520|nr:DUF3168 domain-containing protein [Rhizobium sp. P007]CAD7043665.1 hypothetical protein RP007_01054 [Rhizobium sp. P007]